MSPGLMRDPSIIFPRREPRHRRDAARRRRRHPDAARRRDPDDAARQIVLTAPIHSGHLRRFAADQGTAGRPAGTTKAAENLRKNVGLESLRADVVEEKKRPRAEDGDVVDAMIDEIGTDGVVPIHRKGNLQFRPDSIDAADQHWLAHSREIWCEKTAEAADFAQHFGAVSLANESLDLAFETVPKIDVDSSTGIGFFSFCHPERSEGPHESRATRDGEKAETLTQTRAILRCAQDDKARARAQPPPQSGHCERNVATPLTSIPQTALALLPRPTLSPGLRAFP